MKKSLFLLILACLTLFARENPFTPVQGEEALGKATSIKESRAFFLNQTIKLPSSARVLKSMQIHYQNLDGSIESKSVKIDKNIDWHDELILQKKLPVTASKQVMQPMEKISKKDKTPSYLDEIKFLNRLEIQFGKNKIFIKTKDKKIRDFLVTSPYKIVLDFRANLSFRTQQHSLHVKPFSNVVFGNHSGYYRLAITLDGQYLYELQTTKEGIFIRVK